jgi:hypothetical protein
MFLLHRGLERILGFVHVYVKFFPFAERAQDVKPNTTASSVNVQIHQHYPTRLHDVVVNYAWEQLYVFLSQLDVKDRSGPRPRFCLMQAC